MFSGQKIPSITQVRSASMISVCSHGSCQSQGSSALISDLEDPDRGARVGLTMRGNNDEKMMEIYEDTMKI